MMIMSETVLNINEAKRTGYGKSKRWETLALAGIAYAFAFACYASWASHDIVTFDAEGFYSAAGGIAWYEQWLRLGRWGLILLKHIFGTIVYNSAFNTAAFFLFFPLSALLWIFLFDLWTRKPLHLSAKIIFLLLYLSHPVWAEQFAYRNQMECVCFLLCLLPAGLMLFTEFLAGKRWSFLILAFALVLLCLDSYQAFLFLLVEGLFIYFFIRAVSGGEAAKGIWRDILISMLFVIAVFAAGQVLNRLVCAALKVPSGDDYLEEQFQWGARPAAENLRVIGGAILHRSFGADHVFTWAFGVLALVLLFILVLLYAARRAGGPVPVLAAAGIILTPFLLDFATATETVISSQFAFVLALSFLGMFAMDMLQKTTSVRWAVLAAGAAIALLFVRQTEMTSRLLYTDVQTMEEDERIFRDVVATAQAEGAPDYAPLVFVGGRHNTLTDAMAEEEVIGYSYLEIPGFYPEEHKSIDAMLAYGLRVSRPTD